MRPINELTELLSQLPGLGPRQARRVVQYLLARGPAFRTKLAELINAISLATAQCKNCMRFDDSVDGRCPICADAARDRSVLMVVEHDVDIDAVESSLAYSGKYFVIGALMPLGGRKRKGADEPRIEALLHHVDAGIKEGLREVIFALSTTPEGDYTARELKKQIEGSSPTIQTSLLGRGLSVGAEIEYADGETLRSALKNRS